MRHRIKREKSFAERLNEEGRRLREAASKLPSGHDQQMLMRRARQAETASYINDWATSPGLKAPESLGSFSLHRQEVRARQFAATPKKNCND